MIISSHLIEDEWLNIELRHSLPIQCLSEIYFPFTYCDYIYFKLKNTL